MFEQRKTITVKGVSFDMILVEGDKFHIGERVVELNDFYMAEIPVTQELYMAVMGPAHTGSYNMMPDNFDYLYPRSSYFRNIIVPNESLAEYEQRIERESRERFDREHKEKERIRELAASLPVNNISWLDAIEFIKRLNGLTGLNFALPSFEQWYFAASGGVESKGFAFAGSDDANEVGHFSKLSTINYSTGLFVMASNNEKPKKRKASSVWYEKPKQYRPNELGLFDMTGLVNEWLDTSGMYIGGSYYSNPDEVSKKHNFGYASFSNLRRFAQQFAATVVSSYQVHTGNLYGLRLILGKSPKQYDIPKAPDHSVKPTANENWLADVIKKNSDLGLFRTFVANKYVKPASIRCKEEHVAFGSISQSIQNVFICPQNFPSFEGNCFDGYSSRQRFVEYCKDKFVRLLTFLSDRGFNILVKDNLGIGLTQTGTFSHLKLNLVDCNFRFKRDKMWTRILSENEFITNNPDIIQLSKLISAFGKETKYDTIELTSNLLLVDVNDTINIHQYTPINEEWMYSVDVQESSNNPFLRLTLNCFCVFDDVDSEIVQFMRNHVNSRHTRMHDENFDNSETINWLFCKRNQGGLFECSYPQSLGRYLISDNKFFVLPQPVFEEWSQSLKNEQL